MFNTVQLVLDIFGRPVFVVPEEMSSKDCEVVVNDLSVEFFSAAKKIGEVENIPVEILALAAMQDKVGIIAWDDAKTKECPSELTHVARVRDKRDLSR